VELLSRFNTHSIRSIIVIVPEVVLR